jgi:HTH-type transcriptional regulator / antitoxin HigA
MLGVTTSDVKQILDGGVEIDAKLADRLHCTIGGSKHFWIEREQQYRQDLKRLDQEKKWLKDIPWREMVSLGWLEDPKYKSQILHRCLEFFGVSSVGEWENVYCSFGPAAAFRTSATFASLEGPEAAWLRRSEIVAESIECDNWNPRAFRDELNSLRELTRQKSPSTFLNDLQKRCAKCGVAVVILRAPKGCRHSGATKFLSPQKAMLTLSFRHLSDDHFWFTFFHEAGHLLVHDKKFSFIEGPDTINSKEEEEANNFAARFLIPDQYRVEFQKLRSNRWEIVRFARKIGIAPGIVVGQLQHLGILQRQQMNFLKRRFRWD